MYAFQIDERHFVVKSCSTPGQTYEVDMELELCTCPVGQTGAPCKHQAAVIQFFGGLSTIFLPVTAEERKELLKLTPGGKGLVYYLLKFLCCSHVTGQNKF